MAQIETLLPYKVVSHFRLLGVIFDNRFTFRKQYERIQEKAGIRMALVKRVSGCKWGLETRMLKATGDALLVSLLRYGLAVTGSGAPEKFCARWILTS